MKKTMRKISAIVLTVTILVTLAISPANLGVSAEGETTTYQEPYIVTTNPGNVAWDIPEDKNLIKNAGLEKGNTNEAEQSALGTFNNTDGFYRWVSNEVGNVLRTVYVDGKTQPITDYYYLTDEDSHTGNRSLKSAHTKDDWGTFTIYVNVDNTRADRLHDNTNYVFTFWAKTDVATPQYSHYEMIYDPENDKTTHLGDQKNDYDWHMYASKEDVTDGTYDKHSGKYVSGDKNKWKQYSIVFNSGDNAKRIKFRIVGLTGNVYYDDFALYEIDRPIVKDSDYGFYHYSSSANNKTNNLIYDNQNAGMENGTTGWLERLNPEHEKYSEYNPYYSIVTDEKHNGEASLKYYAPQGVAVSPSVKAYNLSHYTNYVFSFWAKGNSNNQNVIKLTFWSNSQSKTLTFWDYSGESSKMATYAINSDDWKQYTFIFNSADSDHFEFWFTGTAVENPIYFDDFTLIPATAMLTYISENNNTIETITSTSQTTNFE